ncbi:MAG: cupin domain-containing protein [Deltaproteobacteria bacterium]|nr:cupin domain-containing protein [Deltaproteobacteria bacterium]
MSVVKNVSQIETRPHPFLRGITMKVLYSKEEDDGDATCFIVTCPVGSEIEEHIHPNETDIIYVLKGRATMWIEDRGELKLKPGVFVAVPKGVKHRTYNVKEDLHVYDVFTPPMF